MKLRESLPTIKSLLESGSTYNTPTPHAGLPPSKPALAGKELLYKLEDDYRDYRHACNNGYCKSDPAVVADFERRIAAARANA